MSISQRSKSLQARGSALSHTLYQLEVLNSREALPSLPAFEQVLAHHIPHGLRPATPEVLQINVGRKCNQSCAHCHVDAGPDRDEEMTLDTFTTCLEVLRTYDIPRVDITGGAPELNPHFRWFVESCAQLHIEILHRCNLTILVSHPRFYDLPQFFARHRIQVVASLPHYTKLRTDNQRGAGVFADSIRGLQLLNAAGYGEHDTGLELHLVYNPSGAFLPGDQDQLEADFRNHLRSHHGVEFNRLYALANLPISRFLDYLIESGNYAEYMQSLVDNFNPSTIPQLMCRTTLSVSWDGYLYDCDFNQMLNLPVDPGPMHLSEFDPELLMARRIVTNQHCYGCTAGAGSSCGGKLAESSTSGVMPSH